jgi:hypothetical protein
MPGQQLRISYGADVGGSFEWTDTLEVIANALGVDPSRLRTDRGSLRTRVHEALLAPSSAIATYDVPHDGPVRPMPALGAVTRWDDGKPVGGGGRLPE